MARQKYGCDLVVMSPRRLVTTDERRESLELICQLLSDCPPDRYGSIEPLRRRTLCDDVEEAVREWDADGMSLFWKRSKPPLAGNLFSAWRPTFLHSCSTASSKDAEQDRPWLDDYLDASSCQGLADYAVVHVVGEFDIVRGGYQGSGVLTAGSLKPWDVSLFPTTHQLVGGLPDVYWSTVFGRPYVSLIGRERLLSCPDADVIEYGYGGIRITSRLPIHAARTQPEAFEAWREAVREHVGREFFFDASAHGTVLRVPEFAWVEQ